MKYYHELTKSEFKQIISERRTWQWVKDNHPRPAWCMMETAIPNCMALIFGDTSLFNYESCLRCGEHEKNAKQ